MKKRRRKLTMFLLALVGLSFMVPTAYAEETLAQLLEAKQQTISDTDRPSSGIAIDAHNGQILWQENAEETVNPVNLTTLMTIYLTLEKMEEKNQTLNSTIQASDVHQAISQLPSFTNNQIYAGTAYSYKELMEASLLSGSNVAGLMLSETVSTDPDQFVKQMNAKAKKLGMTQTTFYNATGVPASFMAGYYTLNSTDGNAENQSTAKDMAILTYHLLNDFPKILDITKQAKVTIQKDTAAQETLESMNLAVKGQPYATTGTDGLKISGNAETGYHSILTTKRNEMRVITVLFSAGELKNEQSEKNLYISQQVLTDYLFDTYEFKDLLTAGEQNIQDKEIKVEKDLYAVIPKESTPEFTLGEKSISLKNHLPYVAKTVKPLKVAIQETQAEEETSILSHPVVKFLIQNIRVTQLTILSAGSFLIGILFMLMALFLPKEKKAAPPSEEEATRTRRRNRQSSRSKLPLFIALFGLGLSIAGLVGIFIQYI